MRIACLSLALAIGYLTTVTPAQESPTLAEVERAHRLLSGTWQVVEVVDDGERLGANLIREKLARGGQVQFANRSLLIVDPITAATHSKPFRLNPATQPRRIDLTTRDDRQQPGIYMLDGDTLTICAALHPDTPRPTQFQSDPGSGLFLARLKMVSASTTPPVSEPAADAAAKPAPADPEAVRVRQASTPARTVPAPDRMPTDSEIEAARNLLSGNWDILRVVDSGEVLGPELIRLRFAEDGRVRFTHRTATLVTPTTEEQRSVYYSVNPATTPSLIDVVTNFDRVLKGIYAFDGDVLKVCVARSDAVPRPTAFEAPAGSDLRLYELRVAPPDAPPPPIPPTPEQIARERDMTIRKMLVGTWATTDAQGNLTASFRGDGRFASSRIWSQQARGMFGSKSDTAEGTWLFATNRLTAQITSTTNRQVIGRVMSFRIASIGGDKIQAVDSLGHSLTLVRVR